MRALRLIWFVTWFNVRMLLTSEFFVLTTFLTPLIFATLAFFLFKAGGATEGQTLLYVGLGSGMMGVWSTTLFGCGGAIAWQRWEDAGTARQRAVATTTSWPARPSAPWCLASRHRGDPRLGRAAVRHAAHRYLPADPAHSRSPRPYCRSGRWAC